MWSTFFLSLCAFQKQTQVVMFVWQVPYPLKGPTILSFGYCYCYPYIMTVLLASQANSYVYKDYFPNPNKKIPQKCCATLSKNNLHLKTQVLLAKKRC